MSSVARRASTRRVMVLCRLFVILLALLPILVARSAAHADTQSGDLIKVYVVRSAAQNGGVTDTLPEIAQRTLGDASRASQVFTLNQGRRQADGGVLTSPGQPLHPGWILRLPSDASGPFVQLGRDTGASGDIGGVRIPVLLAAGGGLLLLAVTLLIVLRRRTARGARWFTRAVGAIGGRMAAPARRRRAQRTRQRLAAAWRADGSGFLAVRAALADVDRVLGPTGPGPVGVDLVGDTVRVSPVPDMSAPSPWRQEDGTSAWHIPRWTRFPVNHGSPLGLPVLIGGSADRQTFVDISYCDSVLTLVGDRRTTSEVLAALANDITRHHPDLRIVVLGDPPAGLPTGVPRFQHSSELAAVIGQGRRLTESPVRAAAQRRHVTGVIVVPAGTPQQESAEVARLCGSFGSTWLALVAGDVVGAHWRFHVDSGGAMEVPFLDRTIIATV